MIPLECPSPVVMNYVVVPLSAAGPGSKEPLWIALTVLIHVGDIGIPCAVFVRRAILVEHSRGRSRPA